MVFKGNRHLVDGALHGAPQIRGAPGRLGAVPRRPCTLRGAAGAPLPLMFGRTALQRDSQPPYAYGFSSLLYYKHLLEPIYYETVLNGDGRGILARPGRAEHIGHFHHRRNTRSPGPGPNGYGAAAVDLWINIVAGGVEWLLHRRILTNGRQAPHIPRELESGMFGVNRRRTPRGIVKLHIRYCAGESAALK
jgi:hypothetical protein